MPRTLADDMRDDFSAVFLNTDEFAETVVHKKRNLSLISVVAVWTPHSAGSRIDDSKGTRIPQSGVLLSSATDVNGSPFVVDELGLFLIDEIPWQIKNVTKVSGGWSVDLYRENEKLVKR